MRPLPRLHAITDANVLGLEDLGVRAAAIAAGGPSVALHVRNHSATARELVTTTRRFISLAQPPEAAVLVNGHPEIARACGAQGVQLRQTDLTPADARRILVSGWIGCSVHSTEEAETAARNGADFLLLGNVYSTSSHPGQPGKGLDLIARCSTLGVPVIAVGGITGVRAGEVRDAGGYGVAAISALWYAADPAAATLELLEPWILDA